MHLSTSQALGILDLVEVISTPIRQYPPEKSNSRTDEILIELSHKTREVTVLEMLRKDILGEVVGLR
jgi:hypothetical protein